MSKKKDVIQYWLEVGAEIAGETISNVISSADSSVGGSIIGGTLGPLVGNTIKNIGREMQNRFLSKRQQQRTGLSVFYMIERFNENIDGGRSVRTDSFFDNVEGNCSDAGELAEGVLIVAQESFEEKKLKYISYFYANLLFESHRDKFHANHFLAVARTLTFRQLCLLAIYHDKKKYGIGNKIDPLGASMKVVRHDIIAEMYSLHDKKLFHVATPFQTFQFPTENAQITDHGNELYRMFSLDKIHVDEIAEIGNQLGLVIFKDDQPTQ